MANLLRPRVLAGIFGAYFLIIALGAWLQASSLATPWYDADLSRWVYLAYLVAAAALLAGSGLIAVVRTQYVAQRIAEVGEAIEAAGASHAEPASAEVVSEELPPPLPEEPMAAQADKDIDDLLESLSEMETSAQVAAEVEAVEGPGPAEAEAMVAAPEGKAAGSLVRKRERLKAMRKAILPFLAGPIAGSLVILGVSAAMLPGVEGMLQSYHRLNTAIVLGFAYGWAGLGAYFAAAVAGLLRMR